MPLPANPLPKERISELLELCPETGSGLVWKKAPPFKPQLKGKPAGCRHHSGYWDVMLEGTAYRSHRIVWYLSRGSDPGVKEIDHIDRNKSNNTPENLRLASRSLQSQNRNKWKGSSSAFRGVTWHKVSGKWHAVCRLRREDGSLTRPKYLGQFEHEKEAWTEVLKHRPEWA